MSDTKTKTNSLRTITPSELAKILKAHRLWRETNGVQGNCANLEGANLYDANLSWANLRGAKLQGVNLEGAYLRSANLRSANLRSANLQGANLQDANLQDANLSGANLRDADLRGAKLQDANLRYANLRGANLEGAYLEGTLVSAPSSIVDGKLVAETSAEEAIKSVSDPAINPFTTYDQIVELFAKLPVESHQAVFHAIRTKFGS